MIMSCKAHCEFCPISVQINLSFDALIKVVERHLTLAVRPLYMTMHLLPLTGQCLCALSVWQCTCLHSSLMVVSPDPDRMSPVGVTARERTGPSCPSSTITELPSDGPHTRTILLRHAICIFACELPACPMIILVPE
jgi:hypothetical protein